jgi:hypothetical protein
MGPNRPVVGEPTPKPVSLSAQEDLIQNDINTASVGHEGSSRGQTGKQQNKKKQSTRTVEATPKKGDRMTSVTCTEDEQNSKKSKTTLLRQRVTETQYLTYTLHH